jgi:hypothetical protein
MKILNGELTKFLTSLYPKNNAYYSCTGLGPRVPVISAALNEVKSYPFPSALRVGNFTRDQWGIFL